MPEQISAQVRLNAQAAFTGSEARFPLEVPERGVHQLQVQLVDATGSVITASNTIEIYTKKSLVKQTPQPSNRSK